MPRIGTGRSNDLQFRLLGPLEALRDGEPVALGGAKQRALLAVLLLQPDRVVAVEELIERLWPHHAPGKPETAVQGYVSQLRKVLEPEHRSGAAFDVLVTEASGYRARVGSDAVDIRQFARLLADAKEGVARGHPRDAWDLLTKALALWRGSPLAEFGDLPWAVAERTRLEEMRLSCVEEQIEAALALGRNDEAINDLQNLIAHEPLRERPRGQLMRALYRAGRQAEALSAYQETRKTLDEELGIDPSPELQALEVAILRQEPSLTLVVTLPAPPTNIPAPATPLVGRTIELAAVESLLSRPEIRLITITGPGGIGKTRFALEAASGVLARFPDGVWWVALETVRDEELVLPAIARAVGVTEDLAAQISDKKMLLVLDNLEQVTAVGPKIAGLLSACAHVTVLGTSREPLHLRAEHQHPLPPLTGTDAVSLFTERARAIRPDFDATPEVAQICARVDGLPLAIELAAARVRVLSTRKILERLEQRLPSLAGGARDLPERQRTLTATIAWSYDLLADGERQLFARLAVFSGGCTLEAAESVCEAEVATLNSLLDKSLLRLDGERYAMLETIREYAVALLDTSPDAGTIRQRRSAWFLALAERIEPHLYDAGATDARRLLEADHDNLRETLRYAVDRGDDDTLLRVATALGAFWNDRGPLRQGLDWLDRALASNRSPTEAVAKAHLRAGGIAEKMGDLPAARRHWEESLRVAQLIGNERTAASANGNLGNLALASGDYAEATERFEIATAYFSKIGDDLGVSIGLGAVGTAALLAGRVARAIEILDEGVARARKVGNEGHLAGTLHSLGIARLAAGDHVTALAVMKETLAAARSAEEPSLVIGAIEGLAAIAAATSRLPRAVCLFGFADAFRRQTAIGDPITRKLAEPYLEMARAAIPENEMKAAWDEGQRWTLETALALVSAE